MAGVVVDVVSRERYTAAAGRGARCDDRPLQVSAATELPSALLGTGFSYDPPTRRRQAEALATVLPAVRDVRRSGSAALRRSDSAGSAVSCRSSQ